MRSAGILEQGDVVIRRPPLTATNQIIVVAQDVILRNYAIGDRRENVPHTSECRLSIIHEDT